MLSDTPSNILNESVDGILKYVTDSVREIPSARVRLNYTKMLYDLLGYELTPDIALASVSEPQAELVIATAGSGKTTWSQIKGIEQKLFRKQKSGNGKPIEGRQILSLVYNNHNVSDMSERHAHMVGKLMAANVKGLNIDDQINACTMHSFCDFFRRQYMARLNLVNFNLATDEEAKQFMERAANMEFKIRKYAEIPVFSADKLHSLYTLTKETLSTVEECSQYDVYTDIGLDDELVEAIFQRYEQLKTKSRRYEFIDMLFSIYQLLKADQKVLANVQGYYEYVIADEVQDFTPLMWGLLQLFVSDGTPLTCIGDEDQNLYNFRGASIDGILNFKKMFPEGKIYTISENRRCRETIIKEARRVIERNTLRFDKKIIGNKQGGVISAIPYRTLDGQITKVVNELQKLSPDDLNSTVICYRDSKYSLLISDMLIEAGIPLYCIRSYAPYSHELFKHLIEVFTALESPMDRSNYKCLWKVLPCKKQEFFEAIHYNPSMNRFTTPDDKVHFANFNYGRLMQYRGFVEAISVLNSISEALDTQPMAKLFPAIMSLLKLYFWNYKKSVNNNEEMDDIFEKRVAKKFMCDKTFAMLYSEMQSARSSCISNGKSKSGVAISTFHSLKGLEFKNVYAVCLDDGIFPNFALIESKSYTPDIITALKEAETRLWYVTITRAIDHLTFCYKESNPTIYVRDYLDSLGNTEVQHIEDDDFADESIQELDDFADESIQELDDFAGDDSIEEQSISTESENGFQHTNEQESTQVFSLDNLDNDTIKMSPKSNSGYLGQLFASL